MGSTKLCGWFGLLFVVSSIVSFIGFSDSASAASIHDDKYITTDKLRISYKEGDTDVCYYDDIGFDYVIQAVKTADNIPGSVKADLDLAINGAGLLINQNIAYSSYWDTENQSILLTYPKQGDMLKAQFVDEYEYGIPVFVGENYDTPPHEPMNTVHIGLSGCEIVIGSWDIWGDTLSQNDVGGVTIKNYLFTGELVNGYPDGYEGLEINDTVAGVKNNLYPHFTYLVTDKEIKATHDLTQQLPDLPEPDEGWQNNEWQVMWYLFRCSSIDDDDIIDCPDRETVHSELLHRDEEYTWEVDEYGDYLLIAEFRYQSCLRSDSWPETPDYCYLNSEHDEYSFVPGRTVYLPIDGMNIVGDTKNLNCDVAGNCYDDTRFKECNVVVAIATLSFDDFNYADCLENITLLANMLSFDTIRFSNSWVSSGNCYTLGTLGNWLNLENKQVCPYFSNEVRNTITPFITFLLGLVMIRFIAMKGDHGTMREKV